MLMKDPCLINTTVANTAAAQSTNPILSFLLSPAFFMAISLVIFFWFGYRDRKRQQEMINNLQIGAIVETHDGTIGTVIEIKIDTVILDSVGSKIEKTKLAIKSVKKITE